MKLRGHLIYLDENGEYRYSDTQELTAITWETRDCGHCHLPNRPDDHDACLGELPKVINACCGHGSEAEAYVQYEDGNIERGAIVLKNWRMNK